MKDLSRKRDRFLPQTWVLSRQARHVNRHYRAQMEKLAPLTEQDREDWHHAWMEASGTIREEQELLVTNRLLRKARRLIVDVPDHPQSDDEDHEYWGRAWFAGGWYLTAAGISKVRSAIRSERKERREALLAWVAPIIALIGALTGLVAVFRK